MKHDIKVKWTGGYPNLCSGHWEIIIDGKYLTNLMNSNFETFGTYSSWHFEEWNEVFEDYEDGLCFEQWKQDPPNNLLFSLKLAGFEVTENLLQELYLAINSQDWRHSSCGGCI